MIVNIDKLIKVHEQENLEENERDFFFYICGNKFIAELKKHKARAGCLTAWELEIRGANLGKYVLFPFNPEDEMIQKQIQIFIKEGCDKYEKDRISTLLR